MSIPDNIEPPQWVNTGAASSGGLDLLGLRLPVQVIGNSLLDGVNTATNQARYVALRAWLIYRYGQTGALDSEHAFSSFASRIECAWVLANLTANPQAVGLVGADKAMRLLATDLESLPLEPLTLTPAAMVFGTPSDLLGVSMPRDAGVPALTSERGIPLAKIVESNLSQNPVIRKLIAEPDIKEISRDEIETLSEVARIDSIPINESEALCGLLMPMKPRPQELARVATYATLLTLAEANEAMPSERQFFNAACSTKRFGVAELNLIANGWTIYCIRDVLAICHESIMSTVMTELSMAHEQGNSAVLANELVASLMQRTEEHASALRDLGLLGAAESLAGMSFCELKARVEQIIAATRMTEHGLTRWDSKLVEPLVYATAQRAGAGSLSVALVAWILVGLRVGGDISESLFGSDNLSYQGARRLGLMEVVLPQLGRFEREDLSLRQAAAELAFMTVHQHLQIAWSRLQTDIVKDVSLLDVEEGKWIYRGKTFGGGQTATRLNIAASWLRQLGLLSGDGITERGRAARDAALRVLREEESA